MLDNQLIALFRPLIIAGMSMRGYGNVEVKQSYQPTQQGVSNTPVIYFFKVSDHRYGFPKRTAAYDPIAGVTNLTTITYYETTFQINGLVVQDPTNINGITASDLVKITAEILQHDIALDILHAAEVGIERITDIRNPYFLDDRNRFEASPSFDFTLTHKQVNVVIVPDTQNAESGIFPI